MGPSRRFLAGERGQLTLEYILVLMFGIVGTVLLLATISMLLSEELLGQAWENVEDEYLKEYQKLQSVALGDLQIDHEGKAAFVLRNNEHAGIIITEAVLTVAGRQVESIETRPDEGCKNGVVVGGNEEVLLTNPSAVFVYIGDVTNDLALDLSYIIVGDEYPNIHSQELRRERLAIKESVTLTWEMDEQMVIDCDEDGLPNYVDDDIDGDGLANDIDLDADGDGVFNCDDSDMDTDGDGVPD